MRRQRAAGPLEIWAARAWNVFNEGRPFSLLYPALVLVCAAPLGLGPQGPLAIALACALPLALVQSRFEFPLRARALLWLALVISIPLLEPWRSPALLAGALAGFVALSLLGWGGGYFPPCPPAGGCRDIRGTASHLRGSPRSPGAST